MIHHEMKEWGEWLPAAATLGIAADTSLVQKFGQNPDLDGAEEDIWTGGGTYTFQTSAQSVEILGGAADTPTGPGTGAWTVRVFGLDANWALQQEDVTMNGTTPVPLTKTYIRIFRAYVLTCGTDGTNNALITIRVASGGATMALIGAGEGQTLMAIYTVPAGYKGLLVHMDINYSADATTTVAATADLRTREFGGAWRIRRTAQIVSAGGGYQHRFTGGLSLPAKTDIRLVSQSNTGTNRVVSGSFDLLLFPTS